MQKVLLLTTCLLWAAAATAAESIPDAGPDSSTRTLIWPDGTRYVGGVSDGKRDGKGTILWQDGTRFVGNFTNDLRNGPGTMVLANGTVYTGYFTDDVLVENPLPAAFDAENTDTDVIQASSSSPTRPIEMTAPVEATTPLHQPVTQLNDAVQLALQASIDNWAAHWSKQDLPAYLNSYSEAFDVPGKLTRSQWEDQRKTRLGSPAYIGISIVYDSFEIIDADEARVTFKQTYKSDSYNDVTQKFLLLNKHDDQWLISAEGSQ